jgi:glycosyltransferase involved in cell wall biosynthesis
MKAAAAIATTTYTVSSKAEICLMFGAKPTKGSCARRRPHAPLTWTAVRPGNTPLRVGLDLTGLELDTAGSARAIVALRDELRRRDDVALVEFSQPPGRTRAGRGRIVRGLAREGTWLPARLPLRARAARVDLLHCPVPLAPIRAGVPLVVTIYDAMPLRHPEWFPRANVAEVRLVARRALRRAAAVVCASEHARGDIADAFDLDPARIHVAPLGVDERFSPGPVPAGLPERLGVGPRYVLCVATLQPRKNLRGALAAFERLVAAGAPHQLVVVGARGWRDAPDLLALRDSPVADRIVTPGWVSDPDLVGLMRGADAVVVPSLYEGFGLPALEAMACGAPVACSDRTALPEVVGDTAELADPADSAAFAGAIARAIEPARAAELRAAGPLRAARFTWAGCADRVVGAYRAAYG